MINITMPITDKAQLLALNAGDIVRLSGRVLTGRDAAHKRFIEALDDSKPNRGLPFDIAGQCIYYVGPCPAKEGEVIGPCGPTTAGRVDVYTPALLDMGLCAMIGKGVRADEVVQSMVKNGAVYFAATGGAACLLQKCVVSSEVVAYDDLGAEAVRRLEVKDMPLVVAIDSKGNSLYNYK